MGAAVELMTRAYADSRYVNTAGDTMTGALILSGDPSTGLGAATKQYVDALAAGLAPKAVRCGTTANITLSGAQTIDGIAAIAGDRVLVKNQTAPAENGIYVVAAGAWARATDMDAWSEVPSTLAIVQLGSTLADTGWVCTSDLGGTLNTTAITFAIFFGSPAIVGTANQITVSLSGGIATLSIPAVAQIATSLAIGGATIGANSFANTGPFLNTGAMVLSTASFTQSGNISGVATTTAGSRFIQAAAQVSDTSTGAGTLANDNVNVFGITTLNFTNNVVVTNAHGNVFNGPVYGTGGGSITNKYAGTFKGGAVLVDDVGDLSRTIRLYGDSIQKNAGASDFYIGHAVNDGAANMQLWTTATTSVIKFSPGGADATKFIIGSGTALNPTLIGRSGAVIGWSSSATAPTEATIRTGISEGGAGIVLFGTGAAGSIAGAISLTGITNAGNETFTVAASGPILKQGANGRCGTFVANGATPVTVNNTSVAITDFIGFSLNTASGTVSVIEPTIATITAATGFTVVAQVGDLSTYNYVIIKNAA